MRCSLKVRASVGAAASLLLVLIAVVPAQAGRDSGMAFAPLWTHAAFRGVLANGTSRHFGGWVFSPKGAASAVSKFRLPSPKCGSRRTGVAPGTFMATGRSSAPKINAAGVLMECISGKPAAEAQVVVDGAATGSARALFGGDRMKGTVTTSATKTTATIQDLTAGHTFTLTKSGAGAASLEELLIDDSLVSSTGTQLPVANFGTIPFSAATVGGKALGSVTRREAINMETSTHVLQIRTGGLTGTKKNAFNTTRKHS
ncbi:MAG: G1 family glutamic endopeptidase [Solirubrobacteraceae bacterium]